MALEDHGVSSFKIFMFYGDKLRWITCLQAWLARLTSGRRQGLMGYTAQVTSNMCVTFLVV